MILERMELIELEIDWKLPDDIHNMHTIYIANPNGKAKQMAHTAESISRSLALEPDCELDRAAEIEKFDR